MDFSEVIKSYTRRLQEAFQCTIVTKRTIPRGAQFKDEQLTIAQGVQALVSLFLAIGPGRILFVGNGGSAAICSHYAVDYEKNGGLRTMVFTDPARMTCYANDMGYEQAYAEMIKRHARSGDLLIAISSSGRSQNIIHAAQAGRREAGCFVITMSGFLPANPLREYGLLDFYVPSARFAYAVPLQEYGVVETVHSIILHCALDLLLEQKGHGNAVI